MQSFASGSPFISRLDTIGYTVKGKLLLALKISDSVNIEESEPRVFLTSSIHGDELTGCMLMLHLIDSLLTGYSSSPRIKRLIDNLEIYINPLANPDGTFKISDTTVYGATRFNANAIDLNRNFPDPAAGEHPDGNQWQMETQAMMKYMQGKHFTLSANFHGESRSG
jgi:murein tripeptide amidase MpaA